MADQPDQEEADLPQIDFSASLPTELTPIGAKFAPATDKDPYENYSAFYQWFKTLKPGDKDPKDGARILHAPDGTVAGKLYADRSFVFEHDGQRFLASADGTIKEMKRGTPEPKSPEAEATSAAAKKNVLRSQFSEGVTGDAQFEQAKQSALNPPKPPKIFRDTTTGLAFDISNPQDPKPLNLPGNPASVDLSGIKEGDWASVPEDLRDVAQNIAAYKYPKLSGFALRSPYFQQMFKIIGKVDPAFNYQQYDARQKFLTDFSGSGKMGQNRLSFNTALDHINSALDSSDELAKKFDADQLSNAVVLHGKQIAGSTELNKYESDASEVAKELERAFSGSAPTVSGMEKARGELVGGFGRILTSDQRKTALKEKAKLLGSRLGEMGRMYESTMQKPLDISLVSPEAEKTLRRLGLDELADKYGSHGGKRPYTDFESKPHAVSPFPGSDKDVGSTEHEVVEDAEGHRFIVSPEGKLIPYGQ